MRRIDLIENAFSEFILNCKNVTEITVTIKEGQT